MSAEESAERLHVQEPSPDTPVVKLGGRFSVRSHSGLILALAGGGLTWFILQATYPVFSMPKELINLGPSATAEQELAQFVAQEKIHRQHAIMYVALLGALVGSGLSVSQASRYRSTRAAVYGGAVVFILGGLFGAAGGLVGDIAYAGTRTSEQPLSLLGTILVQVVTLGTLGVGVGLGLGIAGGQLVAAGKNLAAGLLVGICAGMCYPLIVGTLLPNAQTESTLPTDRLNQLVWITVTSCLLGLIIPEVAGLPTDRPLPDCARTSES